MNIAVVVCLYDRHENLRRWLHAWDKRNLKEANLYIINNKYEGLDVEFWQNYCEERGVKYILRENVGYETGVFQDAIQKDRYIEDWDWLISCTDDTLPIRPSFIEEYVGAAVEDGVGCACMEMSGLITPHIRTTGFCISRETANKLVFPRQNSQVITKNDCYHFEHRGGDETFLAQILKMGKRVVQVGNLENSALWDTNYTKFNRWLEWHTNFPGYER